MVVLDTNVVSELMRPHPNAVVTEWFAAQMPAALYTTVVTEAEIGAGIASLPAGKRRLALQSSASVYLARAFADRILPFDSVAAPHYADILAARRRAGRPIKALDAMIAAIARSRGAAVATRDGDFQGCGIAVIDPWRKT